MEIHPMSEIPMQIQLLNWVRTTAATYKVHRQYVGHCAKVVPGEGQSTMHVPLHTKDVIFQAFPYVHYARMQVRILTHS